MTKGNGKIRFMNCAIVSMILKYNSTLKRWELLANLFYNGTIDEKKPDYVYYVNFVPDGVNELKVADNYKTFPFYPQTRTENVLVALKTNERFVNQQNTYNFFIMRHGQATHNVQKGFTKLYNSFTLENTHLTDEGKRQANEASKALSTSGFVPNFIFVSDLVRTQETLSELNTINILKPIFMLPCSHEIDGNCNTCDGCPSIPAGENRTNDSSFLNDQLYIKLKKNAVLKGNYYTFYGKGRRSILSTRSRDNCVDNTFIGLALKYINETRGGKTRKKRSKSRVKYFK